MSRRNQRHFIRCVVGLMLGMVAPSGGGLALAQSGASFQGLGLPDGAFFSQAYGVSTDGSVVVGWSEFDFGRREGFRWEDLNGNGLVDLDEKLDEHPEFGLGDLGGDVGSLAYGVSPDGSVIVGMSASGAVDPNSGRGWEAFRWTQATGMVGLGRLSGGLAKSRALGVSADGSVVVGWSRYNVEAFRWEDLNGNGLVDLDEKLDDHPEFGLGDLVGGNLSGAFGVSADGSVVVGGATSASGNEAFRWTETGMVGLGFLPGGIFSSNATDLSPDGSVVVGGAVTPASDPYYEAFRWTEATGMVSLGLGPRPLLGTVASGVSEDGSVIVGQGRSPSGAPWIWDPINGLRALDGVLVDDYGLGSELSGWAVTTVRDISDDGRVIVGAGYNPNGYYEAWRVILPECLTDADCEDGLYCTATDTCVNNVCTSIGGPCPPGQTCDEQNDTCVADPFPTVSAWGLIIMALLLLTGIKVKFAVRQPERA